MPEEIKELKNIIGEDDEYEVSYDAETITIYFKGELALGGASEYEPIKNLLNDIVEAQPATITLNLEELEFCNSSGISMLSKFVLGLRKKKGIEVFVSGSNEIPWQSKSLQNLTKLLPKRLTLEFKGGE
ncbi:MAG: STAS domain-containing protein [Cyanobacteria bacterium P01_E01_bin.42]